MDFLFFNAAGAVLFTRSDAESASVTHEEMSLQAMFPYDGGKEILRGMRVGCMDAFGVMQVYEVRKVKTLEPDHYQQLTAEHIAISELTDEFCDKAEVTDKTAAQALSPLLTGTGWAVGTDTTSNTSSCDISLGDVWSATRTIQQNWNVYILPRVTVGAAGITGKYLDIVPAGGTWNGFRLSLDKNANEIGVTWDDSKLKTALYAFGQEKNGTPLTFKDVTWTATAGHPAKPANQTYLEDPAATAAYGRNGRPRFGYYQNAGITNATTLLEKTWEVLQTVELPDVTVDATISDLHRLGFVDVPIRLHDTAQIEVRPTGVVLQKEIIQYTEDLLDPLQSRLVIGAYIPNIIYINRQTAKRGGGGGRGSGDSQDPLEYTIDNNTVQVTIDSRGLSSLCVGTGAQLNPDGSLVVDPVTGKPVFIDTGDTMWSQITQNKQNITLKVSKGDVSTQLAVECGNVTISGGNLVVDGYVTSAGLASEIADLEEVQVNNINGTRAEFVTLDGTYVIGDEGSFAELTIGNTDMANAVYSFGTPTASGGQISIPWTKVDGTAGTPINFNIADTAYYQSHVGIESIGAWEWNTTEDDYVALVRPKAGPDQMVYPPDITTPVTSGNPVWVDSEWTKSVNIGIKGPATSGVTHDLANGVSISVSEDWRERVIAADGKSLSMTIKFAHGVTSLGNVTLTGVGNTVYTNGLNDGKSEAWSLARSKLSFPSATSTTKSGFSFSFPGSSYNSTATYDYSLSVANGYAIVTDDDDIVVAKVSATNAVLATQIDMQVGNASQSIPSAPSGTGSTLVFASVFSDEIMRYAGQSGGPWYIPFDMTISGGTGTKRYYVKIN